MRRSICFVTLSLSKGDTDAAIDRLCHPELSKGDKAAQNNFWLAER
jgi:hypothetical protein